MSDTTRNDKYYGLPRPRCLDKKRIGKGEEIRFATREKPGCPGVMEEGLLSPSGEFIPEPHNLPGYGRRVFGYSFSGLALAQSAVLALAFHFPLASGAVIMGAFLLFSMFMNYGARVVSQPTDAWFRKAKGWDNPEYRKSQGWDFDPEWLRQYYARAELAKCSVEKS